MTSLNLQLFKAVSKVNIPAIKQLLKKGAQPNWKNTHYHNQTALHKAISNASPTCIRLLLQHILKISIKSGDLSCVDHIVNSITSKVCSTPSSQKMVTSVEAKLSVKASDSVIIRVKRVINAIKRGDFVIVFDNKERENEGDLIIATEKVTPQQIAFMVNHTTGLICVSMPESRLKQLKLPQMVSTNTEKHRTAFTISVDFKHGTSTGISAADRAATFLALADQKCGAKDFNRPGHVFPLRCTEGGVLVRPGHTEASSDLAKLAGLYPSAVLCELCNRDGTMSRYRALEHFAEKHKLEMITIADLIQYRKLTEQQPKNKSQQAPLTNINPTEIQG